MAHGTTRAEGIALLLAGSMCVFPFLVPYHQQPILSFYPEWLAAALGVAAVVAMLLTIGRPLERIPFAGVCLACLGVLLLARALLGTPAYAQMPLIGAAYLLLAVCVMWLGAQLARVSGLERTTEVICAFVLAGALLNALGGIGQAHGRAAWLEDFFAAASGARAFGNIAQPNLYANYLAVGQAAMLLLWSRGRLSHWIALLIAGVLIWGSALSASRMALLYPIMFAGLAVLFVRKGTHPGGRPLVAAALALCLAEMVAHAAVPYVHSMPGSATASEWTFGRTVDPSQQLHFAGWHAALRVFADAPAWGAGWGEFAGAAFMTGMPEGMTDGRTVWTSPHNLVLQLLAETGVAGSLFVAAALTAWVFRAFGEALADAISARWFLVSAAGVSLCHSMVEFPLWNAHFLTLTALLMGVSLSGGSPPSRLAGAQRVTGFAACTLLAGVLAWAIRDYWLLDSTRVTGTGMTARGSLPDDARVLRGLSTGPLAPVADKWIFTGVIPSRADLPEQLELSRRVVRYWPSHTFIVKHAILLAMSGDEAEARRLMRRVSGAHPAVARDITIVLSQAQEAAPDAVRVLSKEMGAHK